MACKTFLAIVKTLCCSPSLWSLDQILGMGQLVHIFDHVMPCLTQPCDGHLQSFSSASSESHGEASRANGGELKSFAGIHEDFSFIPAVLCVWKDGDILQWVVGTFENKGLPTEKISGPFRAETLWQALLSLPRSCLPESFQLHTQLKYFYY